MSSAAHTVPANAYLIDLVLPFGNTGLAFPGTLVMEFIPLANSPYKALVGRNLICRGTSTSPSTATTRSACDGAWTRSQTRYERCDRTFTGTALARGIQRCGHAR
jgi:hypothetical protein